MNVSSNAVPKRVTNHERSFARSQRLLSLFVVSSRFLCVRLSVGFYHGSHAALFCLIKVFSSEVAVASLSLIGLFNIFGCLLSGSWSGKYSKKKLLAIIYALRALSIAAFMYFPMTTYSGTRFQCDWVCFGWQPCRQPLASWRKCLVCVTWGCCMALCF